MCLDCNLFSMNSAKGFLVSDIKFLRHPWKLFTVPLIMVAITEHHPLILQRMFSQCFMLVKQISWQMHMCIHKVNEHETYEHFISTEDRLLHDKAGYISQQLSCMYIIYFLFQVEKLHTIIAYLQNIHFLYNDVIYLINICITSHSDNIYSEIISQSIS